MSSASVCHAQTVLQQARVLFLLLLAAITAPRIQSACNNNHNNKTCNKSRNHVSIMHSLHIAGVSIVCSLRVARGALCVSVCCGAVAVLRRAVVKRAGVITACLRVRVGIRLRVCAVCQGIMRVVRCVRSPSTLVCAISAGGT